MVKGDTFIRVYDYFTGKIFRSIEMEYIGDEYEWTKRVLNYFDAWKAETVGKDIYLCLETKSKDTNWRTLVITYLREYMKQYSK